MVGPFSQKWADRIPLVFYQPESETPSPTSRPVGPAASFWSVGQALRRHGDNADLERGRKNFQPTENSFLRLPKTEAKCPICLEEYIAPTRALAATAESSPILRGGADVQDVLQPLRLLTCQHHFHVSRLASCSWRILLIDRHLDTQKECLDRYITQQHAKCPICRTPIQVPPLPRQ